MGWLVSYVLVVTLGSTYALKFGEDFDKDTLDKTFMVVIVTTVLIFVCNLLSIVL